MRIRRGLVALATGLVLTGITFSLSCRYDAIFRGTIVRKEEFVTAVDDNDIEIIPKDRIKVNGIEGATFFTLCRNEDLKGMLSSIKSVEERFNQWHHYPWVFANDEKFTEEFRNKISEAVSGDVSFTTIPYVYWKIPDWINKDKMENKMIELSKTKALYAMSKSYRQMCRFNSGFFYKLKALKNYDWYWRVEPDIVYSCDLIEDPFHTLQKADKLYGFSIAMVEIKETIESLWDITRSHFENRPWWNFQNIRDGSDEAIPNTSLGFIELNADSKKKERGNYNFCHYWSNYEVGNLNFFRGEEYNLYFEALDRTGNFFYERWGDAPVHSMAVSYLLPPEKIQYFDNTGYYHGKIGNCPRDKDYFVKNNCKCNRRLEFSWRRWSCVPRWFDGLDIKSPHRTH